MGLILVFVIVAGIVAGVVASLISGAAGILLALLARRWGRRHVWIAFAVSAAIAAAVLAAIVYTRPLNWGVPGSNTELCIRNYFFLFSAYPSIPGLSLLAGGVCSLMCPRRSEFDSANGLKQGIPDP